MPNPFQTATTQVFPTMIKLEQSPQRRVTVRAFVAINFARAVYLARLGTVSTAD